VKITVCTYRQWNRLRNQADESSSIGTRRDLGWGIGGLDGALCSRTAAWPWRCPGGGHRPVACPCVSSLLFAPPCIAAPHGWGHRHFPPPCYRPHLKYLPPPHPSLASLAAAGNSNHPDDLRVWWPPCPLLMPLSALDGWFSSAARIGRTGGSVHGPHRKGADEWGRDYIATEGVQLLHA
jgi:hypothetical protein